MRCTCSIQFAIFLFLIEKSDTICHISNTVSLFYLLLFIMKPYVLDLDHCLIYASYTEIPELELISQRGYHFLYHRPHAKEFLNFLIKSKCDLIFYTSSKKEYAHWVVQSFGLNKKFPIYSRFYTRKKTTEYGEVYLKSLSKIKISSRSLIPVLDDRPDLWDENGVELIPIDPWHGEKDDDALRQILIKRLKKNDRIKELTITKRTKNGK